MDTTDCKHIEKRAYMAAETPIRAVVNAYIRRCKRAYTQS